MKIAIVQMQVTENKKTNLLHMRELVAEAANRGS